MQYLIFTGILLVFFLIIRRVYRTTEEKYVCLKNGSRSLLDDTYLKEVIEGCPYEVIGLKLTKYYYFGKYSHTKLKLEQYTPRYDRW